MATTTACRKNNKHKNDCETNLTKIKNEIKKQEKRKRKAKKMGEEKEGTSSSLSQGLVTLDPGRSPPSSPNSSTRKACYAVLQSWVSKKFMTEWVLEGSYSCTNVLSCAEHGSKYHCFKEVAIIRHPCHGEYAFDFITSSIILQRDNGDEKFCSAYVPANHLYTGDIFLVNSEEIIRPNLSIREGIVGMTVPQVISSGQRIPHQGDSVPLSRIMSRYRKQVICLEELHTCIQRSSMPGKVIYYHGKILG